MNVQDMKTAILTFAGQDILVIGDLMVDEYLWGDVERISPEAPVQIIDVLRSEYTLGGAGNTVRNLVDLGATVYVASVVDSKENGRLIRGKLTELGVYTEGLFEDPNKVSSKKTRVMAGHQQVLRIDRETRNPIEGRCADKIIDFVANSTSDFDAIIASDYLKGVLTEKVLSSVISAARQANKPIVVDPKGIDYSKYSRATVITPNKKEAAASSRIAIGDEKDLRKAGIKLLQELQADAILITRGSEGMSLFEKGKEAVDIAAEPREVYDVTGAGDTVVSVLGLGLAAGLSYYEAAVLSNIAAGIVVGKVGTATVTAEELEARVALGKTQSIKIKTEEEIVKIALTFREKGKKTVFTNGCFDLLHVGHIKLLQEAKRRGDILIVGLNSDSSVRELKGEGRPVIRDSERAQILSALECVDYVVIFPELTPLGLIKAIKPDVLVKGSDYALEGVVGRDIVEGYGGRVELIDLLENKSSTEIWQKIRSL